MSTFEGNHLTKNAYTKACVPINRVHDTWDACSTRLITDMVYMYETGCASSIDGIDCDIKSNPYEISSTCSIIKKVC